MQKHVSNHDCWAQTLKAFLKPLNRAMLSCVVDWLLMLLRGSLSVTVACSVIIA